MEKDKYKEGKAKELNTWAEKIQQRILKRAEKLEEGDIQDIIHELNAHHINLEMQNEELQKAKAELEKEILQRWTTTVSCGANNGGKRSPA